MQLPAGIVRLFLFAIICFNFLVIPVCASGINTTPDITPKIHSSLVENITLVPLAHDNNKRLASLNPDYIAYKNQIAVKNDAVLLSSLQVSENMQHGLGYIPPTINLSYTKGQDIAEYIRSDPASGILHLGAGPYPSRFDLRTLSKVTPIKDQGAAGSCWAFATYASLESTILPEELRDFSENNMKNLLSGAYSEGFDRDAADGGNALMSTAYLARWTGPINETDDPYNDSSAISPTGIPAIKHVQKVMFLPDMANATDNDNIKSALTTYGVVYTSMYISDYFLNGTNAAYYYPGSNPSNHAVGIVGWDDNYSRYNFTTIPQGDGAFIIKNSWGTFYGDQGYLYISYYDSRIGSNNAVFTGENVQNYDNIYQYDPLGWTSSFGGLSHTEWGANIFRSNSSETLSAISFYAVDTNTSYDLYIYKNPDNGPINSTGYSFRENGIITGPPGYYTKVISPGVAIQANDTFSVVMNLTTQNTIFPLPIELAIMGSSSKATANAGESFYSDDGGNQWSDITSFIPTINICIKAFTVSLPPTAAFSANITSGHAPLVVQFTDNSIGSPATWNWSFGDGSYNTTQNPLHTFTAGGTYTVTLNVTNTKGNNTLTSPDYIIVNGYKIGVFRPSAGQFILNTTPITRTNYGLSTDIPLIGDWNGDGLSEIGVFRPSDRQFILDLNNDGIADKRITFGQSTDLPVTGIWV